MIIVGISLIIVIAIVMIYIIAKKKYSNLNLEIDKKEYPLKEVIYIGIYVGKDLLKNVHLRVFPKQYRKLYDAYLQLYGRKETEAKIQMYYYNKITLIVLILLITAFFSGISGVQTMKLEQSIDNEKTIDRPEFGEGYETREYIVNITDEETNEVSKEEVNLIIAEKEPTEEEIINSVNKAKQNIDEYVIGKNTSFSEVREPLNFYKRDNRANLDLEYNILDYGIFDNKGKIIKSDIPLEGIETSIIITFFYNEILVGNKTVNVRIFPTIINLTREEEVQKDFEDNVLGINATTKHVTDDTVILPAELNETGVVLNWNNKELERVDYTGTYLLLFVGIVLMGLVYFMLDERVEKKVEARKEAIVMEFPIFVDKFVLLLNCGNSVDLALKKSLSNTIAKDSEKSNHPLYAELILTLREIEELGISNIDAFERFGKRCRVPDLMKFSSLIAQSIKKGDKEINQSLEALITEAWEKKKALAKEKGSQASTKLLLPMMLMLIAVLIVVLAPAAFSLSGM